jgi:uncharacterized repeat protein (TIGR02543 family)
MQFFNHSIITSDLTLYARWRQATYTVHFIDYDETMLYSQVVHHSFDASAPTDPIREGYTFLGWDQAYENITSDLVIRALYEINSYEVTFMDYDDVVLKTDMVDHGSAASSPVDPIREGYTFIGWDHACETITSDLVIRALYEINSYEVTFKDYDDAVLKTDMVDHGSEASPPIDPIREGYTFIGWDHAYETITNDLVIRALYEINSYEVTFKDYDDAVFKTDMVDHGAAASPPAEPIREGYTFIGWDAPFTNVRADLTLTAQYQINRYTITFETYDGSLMDTVDLDFDHSLEDYQPEKIGYIFSGWYLEETFDTLVTRVLPRDVTLYALWIEDTTIHMVQVGEFETSYTIPIQTDDGDTTKVEGGYWMATTETTYRLWHEVRIWAEDHGYFFQNLGREGAYGIEGDLPTERKLEPVTAVSWRDAIVWLNALSEKSGLDPVYRTGEGMIIKDSSDSQASVVDAAEQTASNGYRLPTNYEWEMAARWKDDEQSINGSILVGGRYWLPGNYASGAIASYTDEDATDHVAWHHNNSDTGDGRMAHLVQMKAANNLGLYDMSGNVWEWTYDWYPGHEGTYRVVRGGSYDFPLDRLQVGYVYAGNPSDSHRNFGFRILRNGENLSDFTVIFQDYDALIFKTETVRYGQSASSPVDPTREGYTFIGWDQSFDCVTEDLVIEAQYEINQYVVSFVVFWDIPFDPAILDYGSQLDSFQPEKENWIFSGWFLEDTFDTRITTVPSYDVVVYAMWFRIDLVSVGYSGVSYTIPKKNNDSETAQVAGGYSIATTETQYGLWYEVRIWAEAHGYQFHNLGREGNDGDEGAKPTDLFSVLEPVTSVSYLDVLIWLNALSEMDGLDPVYRTPENDIIRDASYLMYNPMIYPGFPPTHNEDGGLTPRST